MSDNGKLTVNGVHYDLPINEAIKHFESLGFEGIANMRKGQPVNCLQARWDVINSEKKGGPKWFYVGDYDATVGKACRIYTFDCDVMPSDRG